MTQRPDDADQLPLVDLEAVRRGLAFTRRAVARHWLLGLLTATAFLGATAAAISVLPPSYKAEARVLVQKREVMQPLVNPRRPFVRELTDPTEGAAEVARSRAVFERAISELRLLEKKKAPGPLARVRAFFSGDEAPSPEEETEAMIERLDKSLEVKAEAGVVSITATWSDPDTAHRLVAIAQEELFAARRQEEVTSVAEAAAILDQRASDAKAEAEKQLGLVLERRESKRRGAKASTLGGLQAEGRWGEAPDQSLVKLRQEILSTRQLAEQLEGERQKRTAELDALLAEQRTVYAEGNPLLRETMEKRAALDAEPAQLLKLRAKERSLVSLFAKRGGKDLELSPNPTAAWPTELTSEDPELEQAKAVLISVSSRASELRSLADTARAELAVAEASFAHRYRVVRPSRPPLQASRMKPFALGAVGTLFALCFGLTAALAAELQTRRRQRATIADASLQRAHA